MTLPDGSWQWWADFGLALLNVPWFFVFFAVYGLRVVGSRHTQKRAGDALQRPGS